MSLKPWLTVLLFIMLVELSKQGCHQSCSGCWKDNNREYCKGCRSTYSYSKHSYYWIFRRYHCYCSTYKYESSGSCRSCHYSCNTCYGGSSSNCKSCPSSSFKRYSSGSSCPCYSRYYSPGTKQCYACHYSCASCTSSSSSSCTSCYSSWNRYKSGSRCLAKTYYYEAGTYVCAACHYTCRTCSGSASYNCLSCTSSHNRYLSNSRCYCKTGYYDVGSRACSPCNYKCRTCTGTSTNCTSCPSGSYRTYTSNSCPCSTTYYETGAVTCSRCHFSCYNCVSSATTCTQCHSSHFRTLSGNSCPCNQFYYQAGVTICPRCHYSCAICNGTSSSHCMACLYSWNRGMSGTTCPCRDPYYDDGSSSVCPPCHHSCASCTNTTKCDTCSSSLQRYFASTSVYCLCHDRYYDRNIQSCGTCHQTCLKCSGTSSSQCTKCNSVAFRQLSGTTCICVDGYYATSSTVQQCSQCTYPCMTCTGTSTNCTGCDAALHRVKSGTTCPCKPKYFENSTKLCQDCHTSCATCTNYSVCVTCISAEGTIKNSSGLCSCPSTHFWTGTVCSPCNYKCLTCLGSSTTCRTCPLNSFRVYAQDKCPCVDKYYDNGSNPICQACHYSCHTCSSGTRTTCLTCDVNTLRIKSGSSCICPQYYYDDQSNAPCLKCHYSCNNCTAGSACTTCLSSLSRSLSSTTNFCECFSTHYESTEKTCHPCMATCLTCQNNISCSSCDSALFRTLNTHTHQCDCQKGYYQNGAKVCVPCDTICAACTQPGTCTECKLGLYRIMNPATSTCDCKPAYVLNVTSNLCMGCQYSCQVCVKGFDTQCESCNTTSFREFITSTKQCDCKIGYYDDGINVLCLPCHYTCKSCSKAADNCTSCPSGTNRQYSSSAGTCKCSQHFFDQMSVFIQTQTCAACSYHCSSCRDPTSCLTCNATLHREFNSLNTECICSIGFFDNGTKSEECSPCPYTCLSCTNSTQCLKCSSAHNRAQPAPLCPCINRFYDTQLDQPLCLACHYSCKTCTNNTECTGCQINYQRIANSTTKLCSCLGRFFDPGQEICSSCSYSCLTCVTNPLNCLTCNTTALRTLNTTTNSCDCNDGWYDSAVQPCYQCEYSCRTCGNNRSCLSCNATNMRQYSQATGLCICMTSYYDTKLQQQKCERCQLTCLTCLNASTCVTCDPARNRTINTTKDYANKIDPYCPCIYSHYSLGKDSHCEPCHYSCAVCDGDKKTNCKFCDVNAQRKIKGGNKCICKDGYFDNNVTMNCPLCHVACSTCWNGFNTTCHTCSPTFYMAEGNYTCFLTCPTYFFDNTTHMVCTWCSPDCLKCINGSNCTSCQAPTFLFRDTAKCIKECPLGMYGNETTRSCEPCKQGCANCSASTNCFQCVNTSYFVDNTSTLCYICSSQCLTCYGPMASNCLTCTYPLYRNRFSQCVPLLCPYGQYVDSVKGCQSCGDLFQNSLKCNITQAQICHKRSLLKNGQCVSCSSVTGYKLNSHGDCNEICGDGLVIKYQCDDGNRKNGDGCSSNCLIEKGWTCSNSSNGSVCALNTQLQMKLKSTYKIPRKNSIYLVLEINLDLYVDGSNFVLTILDIASQFYEVTILKQKTSNLKQVTCKIDYTRSIAKKLIQLDYTKQRRRLYQVPQAAIFEDTSLAEYQKPENKRMLVSVSFQVTVDSFPPAEFIEPGKQSFFETCETLIVYLSITLLALALLIAPRKYAIHSLSISWIPAYFYIIYFHSTSYTNQWISSTMANIKQIALRGGISLGECCSYDDYKETTSQFADNSGFIMIALCLGWAVFGLAKLVDSCMNKSNPSKATSYIWYYLLTLQLTVILQLTYYSVFALSKYQLNNNIDAVNTTVSIFLLCSILFIIAALWYLTYVSKFQGTADQLTSKAATRHTIEKDPTNKTDDNQDYNQVVNLSQIKESTKYNDSNFYKTHSSNSLDSKRPFSVQKREIRHEEEQRSENQSDNMSVSTLVIDDVGESESVFPFDYCFLYKNRTTKSKYYLPLLVTKLFLSALFAVALETQPFSLLTIITLLSTIFFCYLLIVRPFQSSFTNFRVILLEGLLTIVNGKYCLYQYYASKNQYVSWIEEGVIIGMAIILCSTVLFALVEHYRSWIHKIWNLCDGCCLYFRLLGRSKRVIAVGQESQRQDISVKPVQQGDVVEADAFYARVLKKETIKKQYRRERMIRETNMTEKEIMN